MRWFRPTLDRRGGNGRARRAWCAARAIAARSCKTASPSPKSSSKSISPHFTCRKHGSVERSRECDPPSRAELDLVPLCLTPADPRVRQLRLVVKGDPSATRHHRSTTRQERRLPPRASSSSGPRVRPFRRFVLEGGGRSASSRATRRPLSLFARPPRLEPADQRDALLDDEQARLAALRRGREWHWTARPRRPAGRSARRGECRENLLPHRERLCSSNPGERGHTTQGGRVTRTSRPSSHVHNDRHHNHDRASRLAPRRIARFHSGRPPL